MRVAVIGAGGMGGVFGAALAQAGNDVTFVARGAHLNAIQRNGLLVEGDRGTTHVNPAQATDDPASIGPVDLVLFGVKLWDLETAAEQIRPIMGPGTIVIPLQNGIDAPERLAAILGPNAVMGGVAMASANITAPGVIHQIAPMQRLIFGEMGNRPSPRGASLRATCTAAGFESVLAPDMELALWEKFNLLVPHSGMTALTRLPIGQFRDDPDIFAVYEAAMRETTAVGRARGVRLAPDAVKKGLAFARSLPPYHIASMANDLIRGRKLELPWLTGKVVELGRALGVPTPANAFIYAALKPYVNGTPA